MQIQAGNKQNSDAISSLTIYNLGVKLNIQYTRNYFHLYKLLGQEITQMRHKFNTYYTLPVCEFLHLDHSKE
jgi:hypothetical protein